VPESRASSPKPPVTFRIIALLEVLLCSGFPTQLALGGTLVVLGLRPFNHAGSLATTYVVAISLADTIFVLGLVVLFLRAHGERPRDVVIGERRIGAEAAAGIPLILVALGIAVASLLVVQRLAPWLHTVEQNPLQGVLQSRRDAWLFGLVVIVAGGLREEVQRAFILHRFEQWLGGGTVGVVISSVAFGAGHLVQGADVGVATGLLGAFWGVVYLRRRSAVAPIVSHAGFDLLQIVQFMFVRAAGG
jgi:membrane protease YdiL (CAAX protease family)